MKGNISVFISASIGTAVGSLLSRDEAPNLIQHILVLPGRAAQELFSTTIESIQILLIYNQTGT